MNCADCSAPGVYVFDDPGALPVIYCDSCLPHFLRSRAQDGSLSRVSSPEKPKKVTAAKE